MHAGVCICVHTVCVCLHAWVCVGACANVCVCQCVCVCMHMCADTRANLRMDPYRGLEAAVELGEVGMAASEGQNPLLRHGALHIIVL